MEDEEATEKAQKRKRADVRRDQREKKAKTVLQNLKERADDCIPVDWDFKKSTAKEEWAKFKPGSIEWYMMHLILKTEQEGQTRAVYQQKGQDSQLRLEREQKYADSRKEVQQLKDERMTLRAKIKGLETAAAKAKVAALETRGELQAAVEANEDYSKRRANDITQILMLEENMKLADATIKKYEEANLGLQQKLTTIEKREKDVKLDEDEILKTLLNAQHGHHSKVTEDLIKHRNERAELRAENDALRQALEMKTSPALAYRGLSGAYREDLGVERSLTKVRKEENEELAKDHKLKVAVETAGDKAHIRRLESLFKGSVSLMSNIFGVSLKKFKEDALKVIMTAIEQILIAGGKEQQKYVDEETAKALALPSEEEIAALRENEGKKIDKRSLVEKKKDELKAKIPSRVISEIAKKQEKLQVKVKAAQEAAKEADEELNKTVAILVGTAEVGDVEVQETVEGLVDEIGKEQEKAKKGEKAQEEEDTKEEEQQDKEENKKDKKEDRPTDENEEKKEEAKEPGKEDEKEKAEEPEKEEGEIVEEEKVQEEGQQKNDENKGEKDAETETLIDYGEDDA